VVGQSSGPYSRREVAKKLEIVTGIVSKTLLKLLGAIIGVIVAVSRSDEKKQEYEDHDCQH
jgi:hypothetical protein